MVSALQQTDVRVSQLIALRDVHALAGRRHILRGVSFTMGSEPVAISGGNAASTLLAAVAGFVPLAAGRIDFCDCEITNLAPANVALRGISYLPRSARAFHALTVGEHLRIAGRGKHGIWCVDRVYDTFPRLARDRRRAAGTLTPGDQRILSLALALRPGPRLLLLDEPAAGLDAFAVERFATALRRVSAAGVALLIAEHRPKAAARLACRRLRLSAGRVSGM